MENSRTPSPSRTGSQRGHRPPPGRLPRRGYALAARSRRIRLSTGPMAEQTSSSIVIDAPPAAVMDVIADFPAYPEWAKGVKEATVRAEGARGRAKEVFFALDVAPIKDEYTLAYTWNGDRDVSGPWPRARCCGPRRRLRARDRGDGSTEVTYRLALDVSIPLIGMIKRKGESFCGVKNQCRSHVGSCGRTVEGVGGGTQRRRVPTGGDINRAYRGLVSTPHRSRPELRLSLSDDRSDHVPAAWMEVCPQPSAADARRHPEVVWGPQRVLADRRRDRWAVCAAVR